MPEQHSGVFLLQDENTLLPMNAASFATEDDFQKLLSRFPELLVGDQVESPALDSCTPRTSDFHWGNRSFAMVNRSCVS
jgi:hypothetical protein